MRLLYDVNAPLRDGTPCKTIPGGEKVRWEIQTPNGMPFYIEVSLDDFDEEKAELFLKVQSWPRLRVYPSAANTIVVGFGKEDIY